MKYSNAPIFFILLFMHSSALANDVTTSDEPSLLDAQLSELIQRHQLTGDPLKGRTFPNINDKLVQLGKQLFFSKTLGADKTTACVTCHHPKLGGGDGLSLPIGVGAVQADLLGPGRTLKGGKAPVIGRNAPTIFNVALYERSLFHDMRIEKKQTNKGLGLTTPDVAYHERDYLAGENLVHAQARFPFIASDEMRGDFMKGEGNQTVRRAIASRFKKSWGQKFKHAFGVDTDDLDDLINEQNITLAISEYERSQIFVDTPWNRYVKGDKSAISSDAKRGASLFYGSDLEGGLGCVSCHSGDRLTNEKAYNTAMPQIGFGKKDGQSAAEDFGCFSITGDESDMYKFRTPSLLNVAVTGPWGHNGAFTTLEDTIEHMINPKLSIASYSPSMLQQAHIDTTAVKEKSLNALNHPTFNLGDTAYTQDNVRDLKAFLEAQTDSCVNNAECLNQWIAVDNDPDGNRLKAIIKQPTVKPE